MPAITAEPPSVPPDALHIPFLRTSGIPYVPRPHLEYRRGHLSARDAGSETGTALWATGLGLVCAGVVIILVAHVCMRRRGLSVCKFFANLKRSLARKTTQRDCLETDSPKMCTSGIVSLNGELACHANAPSLPGCAAPLCEGSTDIREVQRAATCSNQRSPSQAHPSSHRSPSSRSRVSLDSGESERSEAEHHVESTVLYSATLSREGDPYSDDPFASSHDPESRSERAESPGAFTTRSSTMSLTPSTPGTFGGDDSGYLSDATVSTVPPSYRTYRASRAIPNLRDHPLPRPLPPLPGDVAPPPSAYVGVQREGRAYGSRVSMQEPLTDSRRPRRQTRRGDGLPRKSVDGGVRLNGQELPPAYGSPEDLSR